MKLKKSIKLKQIQEILQEKDGDDHHERITNHCFAFYKFLHKAHFN